MDTVPSHSPVSDDAEREYYSSQIDYIELLTEQQINYVNLYTALGSSWE